MSEENFENTETTNTDSGKKLLTCPCCGKLTMPIPAQVDQADKETFLAAILTGTQYQQTYDLFDSRVHITVRQLPNILRDKLIKIANKAIKEKDSAKQDQTHAILARLYKISPISYIQIDDPTDASKNKVYNMQDNITYCIDRLLEIDVDIEQLQSINNRLVDPSYVSSIPIYILDRVMETHMNQVKVLTESGFDDSFSTGIVHVQ